MKTRIVLALLAYFLTASTNLNAQETSTKPLALRFGGNTMVAEQELIAVTQKCLADYAVESKENRMEVLSYCLSRVKKLLFSKGYLQATLGEPVASATQHEIRAVINVREGPLYRLGKLKVEGSRLFSTENIREWLNLKPGDVANSEVVSCWANQKVKDHYWEGGHAQYAADLEPVFHLRPGALEGTVDFILTINEGPIFTVRSIKFDGDEISEDLSSSLLERMLLRSGDLFNQRLLRESVKTINETAKFQIIEEDRDIVYRFDPAIGQLDITIHLKRKPN